MLKGKKILLGVSGSISAYKSAYIVRELIKAGAEVKVIMTSASLSFISPLTLATLSKNPVIHSFTHGDQGEWNNHVELGLWADLFLIAPASANTIAKMANGLCDNVLMATYLSARCPVMFAPAMDHDMYLHPAVQHNMDLLEKRGNIKINPDKGELASGLIGEGRLKEPHEIVKIVVEFFAKRENSLLKNKTILITAGPTYEAIDPVRFIGNHSSGKMGFAIAKACAQRGAKVILISGPVSQTISHPSIQRIDVISAEDMYKEVEKYKNSYDVAILSAAVADYTPEIKSEHKIKKKETGEELHLKLKSTIDILGTLGKTKKKTQILVGFALETQNEKQNALKKLQSKNLDIIVLNSLNDTGAGFKSDTNKITIMDKNNNCLNFELKSKQEVAEDILNHVETLLS
ncbi:MAG: bifunctional phosphopantothenoylcysteine decarboxylase/phosphopantothenate--cysteine ligase CoaBC [Bacteroidia bacterium]